ncbi:16S rRNA (guanine(966)-N(2))-methyltransferase RsmD [soil metagenome]
MTRIVAGTAGGRSLRSPTGVQTRPTSNRVREALFSALEAAVGPMQGLRFLDLCAGSGAVGLEALSRGASTAVFVEQDQRTAALLRDNAVELRLGGATVVTDSVAHHLSRTYPSRFDVAFCDPPYVLGGEELTEVIELLVGREWLAADAVVVLERSSRGPAPIWPPGMLATRQRRYGDTTLWYGRRSADPAP